jgi:PPOX class probable F420-dependent enzyme
MPTSILFRSSGGVAALYGGGMAAGPTVDELPGWARDLLEAQRVAHLGLVDDEGRPRVLPVTFALVDGAAWSAVDHKPKRHPDRELARVRWLRARPAATLTVDRYDDDWARLAWVQLVCEAAVVDASEHEDVLAVLAARYPQYRAQPPAGPLLRLVPERTVCWRASAVA